MQLTGLGNNSFIMHLHNILKQSIKAQKLGLLSLTGMIKSTKLVGIITLAASRWRSVNKQRR